MTRTNPALVLALAILAGCAATDKATSPAPTSTSAQAAARGPSGEIANVVEVRATVTAIDRANRLVSLRGPAGNQIVVEATPEVRNFDQINVGDEVVVGYREALAWEVKPSTAGKPGVDAASAAARAKAGAQPGAFAARAVTVTTTITGIDKAAGTVTLTGPQGNARTIKVRDPANLDRVKVGDLVDLTYSEAAAIAVRPAR
jgi:Cu/Ag efflux protein CusF